jgi:integrase/recombinase XerD
MFSNKGKQVNRSQVYKLINQIAEKAGIDKRLGCHSFRRSKTEYLLSKG